MKDNLFYDAVIDLFHFLSDAHTSYKCSEMSLLSISKSRYGKHHKMSQTLIK